MAMAPILREAYEKRKPAAPMSEQELQEVQARLARRAQQQEAQHATEAPQGAQQASQAPEGTQRAAMSVIELMDAMKALFDATAQARVLGVWDDVPAVPAYLAAHDLEFLTDVETVQFVRAEVLAEHGFAPGVSAADEPIVGAMVFWLCDSTGAVGGANGAARLHWLSERGAVVGSRACETLEFCATHRSKISFRQRDKRHEHQRRHLQP